MGNKQFRILSFKYAFQGIWSALRKEPNLKFHFIVGVFVILLASILKISREDWAITLLLISFVLVLELTNTAIEAVVDEFTNKEHPGAKLAKDISAGAVLIVVITSVIVGLIIFLPYLF